MGTISTELTGDLVKTGIKKTEQADKKDIVEIKTKQIENKDKPQMGINKRKSQNTENKKTKQQPQQIQEQEPKVIKNKANVKIGVVTHKKESQPLEPAMEIKQTEIKS